MSLYVYEHIIASHYGWELDSIRGMDLQDFYAHLRICMAREAVKNEFQAMLAGATEPGGGIDEKMTSQPQVVSSKRLPSGAVVETTKEKPVSFRGNVKRVRVDKEGNYIGNV